MAQMIRKQIYIEPLQDVNLKKQAKTLGITEAEVIRRAIDSQMSLLVPGLRDLSAWEREKDGIASYIHREEDVSLGFVEGLNNKIRVIQRRAYGLKDEEYLRLKVLTCTLPAI